MAHPTPLTRFVAQHAACVYYVVLNILWFLRYGMLRGLFAAYLTAYKTPHLTPPLSPSPSPTLAYNFSELIEAHAVDTYGQFVDENEEILKQLPPPRVARYTSDTLRLGY